MNKKIVKKTAMYLLVFIVAYLVIGYLFHLVIFPEKKPAISAYFKPGFEFYSKTEGFRQRVFKQENGIVYCNLVVDPFASGPPKHIHTDFDEFVEVCNGEISVWIDGEVKKVKPGEKLLIPRGTPHKPFNETADSIRLKGVAKFPEKFAYNLIQVYGFMDEHPDYEASSKTLLQMSLFTSEGFDSYKGDGPPVFMQKLVSFFTIPFARLIGYKSYYKKYDLINK